MSKTLNTRVKLKYDSSTNWSSIASTFIPLKGEVIFYSDLSEFKLGDGTTTLANLSYFKPTPKGDFVTVGTEQTISGKKTFSAPTNVSGTEQATSVFKTANGGQIIFGKEAGNSGTMIGLDQVAGTRRLNFRASATAGAIVWSQPESNSQLYYDVAIVYFRQCTKVTFDNASTITLSKFKNAGYLYTDSSGNLKSGSLATVATSGKYSDLTGTPTLASVATSGSYNDLSNKPTITDTKNTAGSTNLTSSNLFLIGAMSQSANPQTYSNQYCYIQSSHLFSNKNQVAETYVKDNEHYIATEAGYYKISAASSKNSDGTYNDVTILTTENIAEKGLFVPMTGTISTAMSGGIHQKFAYDIQTSTGGLIAGNSGSTTTSTRYSEAFYGEKGFEYVYYEKNSTYGTDSNAGNYSTTGITYRPTDLSNVGYYTNVDSYLPNGLTVWWSSAGNHTNTGSGLDSDNLGYVNINSYGEIVYKSTYGEETTLALKNIQTKLVSGTSIKTINSKSLLGSGNLSATDIIPTATTSARGIAYLSGFKKVDGTGYATSGYFFDTETGWLICYGTTGSISGAGNTVTFAKSFVGAPLVVVSPFIKSTTETTISTQYRNACTVRCYHNTSGTASASYSASTYYGSFILDTGNTESGYFSYIAIGKFK